MANDVERRRLARELKLERMREQLASGELVIRKMTRLERSSWAKRDREFEANSTPEERARRASAVKKRRKHAELRAGYQAKHSRRRDSGEPTRIGELYG